MSVQRILEPTGHNSDKSKFERIWDQIPNGFSFRRERVELFDSDNLVAYSPIEYHIHPLATEYNQYSDDDLIADVVAFVRDEFGGPHTPVQDRLSGPPNIVGRELTGVAVLNDYLAEVEDTFVYGPYASSLKPPVVSGIAVGEYIHKVLSDSKLGNPANRTGIAVQEFATTIASSLSSQERLCFVMLGFPFKDQNPTRCNAPAHHVDFADVGLLCQLHLQALCFFQGHPFGSDFIILSDGKLYADIFGIDVSHVTQYLEKLRFWRNALNLQGSVHIVDLEECIYRLPETELERFDEMRDRVKTLLLDARRVRESAVLHGAMYSLVAGMKRNVNSSDLLKDEPWDVKVGIIYGDGKSPDPAIHRLERQLTARASSAAAAYAATNVALRRHGVVQRVFENARRATIHPKPGQIGVPRNGTVYPWNGVGVFDPGGRFPDIIKARPLGELDGLASEWIAGFVPGDEYPSYYRRAE